MRQRIQVYLDRDQYRWLKQRAGRRGSMAGVVRELVDAARSPPSPSSIDYPLIRFLAEEPPADSRAASTVDDLDCDLYG